MYSTAVCFVFFSSFLFLHQGQLHFRKQTSRCRCVCGFVCSTFGTMSFLLLLLVVFDVTISQGSSTLTKKPKEQNTAAWRFFPPLFSAMRISFQITGDPLASVCALAQGACPPTVLRMNNVFAAERCLTCSASEILRKRKKKASAKLQTGWI